MGKSKSVTANENGNVLKLAPKVGKAAKAALDEDRLEFCAQIVRRLMADDQLIDWLLERVLVDEDGRALWGAADFAILDVAHACITEMHEREWADDDADARPQARKR